MYDSLKKEKVFCDVQGEFNTDRQYFKMPCNRSKDVGEMLYCTVEKSGKCKYYVDLHFSKLDKLGEKIKKIEEGLDYDIDKTRGKLG